MQIRPLFLELLRVPRALAKPASRLLSSLPLLAAAREHSIIIVGCKTRRNDLHFYSGSSRAAFFLFGIYIMDAALRASI
jgi:hypothetical protein